MHARPETRLGTPGQQKIKFLEFSAELGSSRWLVPAGIGFTVNLEVYGCVGKETVNVALSEVPPSRLRTVTWTAPLRLKARSISSTGISA